MNNIVDEKIENLNKSVEGIVEKLEKMNSYGLTVEDIYEYIKGDSEIFKKSMHFTAINKGHKDLAKKIGDAIKILKKERIDSFIYSVIQGTKDEFLDSLSLHEKICLMADIGNYKNFDVLCPGGREIIKILEGSINSDLIGTVKEEKIDNSQLLIRKAKTSNAYYPRIHGKAFKFN